MEANNFNLTEKFAAELQSLWSLENMLVNKLPEVIAKATDLGVVKSLSHHFTETLQHRTALEGICKQLAIVPNGQPNQMLKDILSENDRDLEENKNGLGTNALIIDGAQKIEQFEISAYEPAVKYAEQLGLQAIRKRLLLTVEEERQASNKLNFLLKNLSVTRSDIVESPVYV